MISTVTWSFPILRFFVQFYFDNYLDLGDCEANQHRHPVPRRARRAVERLSVISSGYTKRGDDNDDEIQRGLVGRDLAGVTEVDVLADLSKLPWKSRAQSR